MGATQQLLASFGSRTWQAETTAWESGIIANSGSVTAGEKIIADDLVIQLKAWAGWSSMIALYPFIGGNIAAHRQPLIDKGSKGACTNTGFVNGDCTTAGGINNTAAAAKYLSTNYVVTDLNASRFGGYGFIALDWGSGGTYVEPMGNYNGGSERYCLDLRSTFQRGRWGGVTSSQCGPATSAGNGHYYLQAKSYTDRKIYKDGSDLGDNGTSSETYTGAAVGAIYIMGVNATSSTQWDGIGGGAYLTDGQLSGTDIGTLHTLLSTYLTTACGR